MEPKLLEVSKVCLLKANMNKSKTVVGLREGKSKRGDFVAVCAKLPSGKSYDLVRIYEEGLVRCTNLPAELVFATELCADGTRQAKIV